MNKKLIFNIILYLSLIFLIIFLYKYEYLDFENLKFNYQFLSVSIVFLWTGFLLSALSWHKVLSNHKIKISIKKAIISHGMVIFAKYIPGKIWVIIGRASKAAENRPSVQVASFASLKEQLLFIWLGLLISSVPLLIYHGFDKFTLGVLILFVFFTFFSFSDFVRKIIISVVRKILKKELELPHLSIKESLNFLLYILAYWFAWILAFYFLAKSIYPAAEFSIGFIFPLSATLGLLAVIVPGGIGVREGIMVGFMVLMDIPIEVATTISVISRLWFLAGEFFIFVLAIVLKNRNKISV